MAAAKKNATPKVTIGQTVVYNSGKGQPKLALVTGTPDTIAEGTSLAPLEEGQLYLTVWEFGRGHFVGKSQVPFEGTATEDNKNSEGVPVRVWRLA
jgi:hypothetical protein